MTTPLGPDDPRALGTYRLVARLGEGGMGAVYLGEDRGGRRVAVKVIRPQLASDPRLRARFRSEVNRARQVPPFCTAAVLDADVDHPTPYLVVEYVDGVDLGAMIRRQGPLAPTDVHGVAVGVATALAAIHSAGVIHRDLKPANVLFSLGTPKVIDFGIARAVDPTMEHTRTDQVVGTIAYMAPERFERGQPVGPAADIFAWGVLVAYAATGRTPFAADCATAIAGRILTQEPDLTGLTGELHRLVAAALGKDPAARPTAHELLGRLLAAREPGAVAGLAAKPQLRWAALAARNHGTASPITTDAAAAWERAARRGRNRKMAKAGAVAAGAVVLVATVAAAATIPSERGGTSAPPPAPRSKPAVTLSVTDALRDFTRRQWQIRPELSDGRCRYTADGLAVHRGSASAYPCPGQTRPFADSIMAVDVVGTAGNTDCAAVWLRAGRERSHRVQLCAQRVEFGRDAPDHDHFELTAAAALPATMVDRDVQRLRITARHVDIEVAVNDTTLLRVQVDPRERRTGPSQLGVAPSATAGVRAPAGDEVTFSEMRVWEP